MRSFSIFAFLILGMTIAGFTLVNEEYGIASYYNDSYQGSETASKEKYDKNKLTGAHKTYPYGTIVKVTRLDNKKSVKVRINDRGPYIKGRIIEVSRKAAEQIGLVNDGVTRVKIEVVGTARKEETAALTPPPPSQPERSIENPDSSPDEFSQAEALAKEKAAEAKEAVEKLAAAKLAAAKKKKELEEAEKQAAIEKAAAEMIAAEKAATKKATVAKPAPKSIDTGVPATRVRGRDFSMYDLYKVQMLRPERSGYGVQVASLTNYANVMRQVAELQEKWFNNILISVEKGTGPEPVYKVMLGPFPDKATAKSYEKDLKRKKKIDGFIVDLSGIKY